MQTLQVTGPTQFLCLIMINPEDADMASFLEDSRKVKKIDESILLTTYVVE